MKTKKNLLLLLMLFVLPFTAYILLLRRPGCSKRSSLVPFANTIGKTNSPRFSPNVAK